MDSEPGSHGSPGSTLAAPAIAVRDLRKAYGRTHAVDGLSLTIVRGSIYGFVGPNGAGKTTTIRILATLLTPDSGTATVDGHDVVAHPGRVRAAIGYMPDFFGTYDNLTVGEYLDFYAASYGVPATRRRQINAELLELVDLAPKEHDLVEGLSRGMKQRLGLARCLVHDPRILLLDEPASGMDPRARVEMREIVRELQRMGKTIVISSHILMELSEMCTHIGIVHAGRVVIDGPVSAVLQSLTRGRSVRITLHAGTDGERALGIVRNHRAVSNARLAEAADDLQHAGPGRSVVLEADVEGDDSVLGDLLRTLVEGGLTVVAFAPIAGSLEEVFMQVTAEAGV
jgi:ABC-2 type transport system ATP-binding protein